MSLRKLVPVLKFEVEPGDASSLPTSKTAATITAVAPVLVRNLTPTLVDKEADASYDGYTSCPLLTEYGKVVLAEFRYGDEPKETFGSLFGIGQATPRRAFYHLKKDFSPRVYYQSYPQRGAPRAAHRRDVHRSTSPTSGSVSSTTLIPQPLLTTSASAASSAVKESQLPPLLKQPTPKKMLTSAQIARVQQLRQLDPNRNTAGKLAKKFGCSPLFIQIVAPAPKLVKEGRLADAKLRKLS
ncbi:hypothetical protein ACQY0O_007949 [Thecaphora frezii]